MVKKGFKILGMVILVLAVIVLVLFQAVGEADWPFGYSHAKVTVKDGDRIIETFREDIADDGGQFRPDNYSVEWMKYG